MKKTPSTIPEGIINPFSEKFIPTWQMWKDYKKETFGFEYKGLFSEQMTLKKLSELSDGDEEKAVNIVEQSVMRQWQGFFPLHIPTKNGKSAKKATGTASTVNSDLQDRVKNAYADRYGNGQQSTGESHLKAV